MTEYWATPALVSQGGFQLELRASMAWELIERFGLVTGQMSGEDTAGRAVPQLLPEGQVVERAFQIADLFVAQAEARGQIRAFGEAEEQRAYQAAGTLHRLQEEAQYPRHQQEEAAR